MKFFKITILFLLINLFSFGEKVSRIITLSHFSTVIMAQLNQEDKMIGEAWSNGVVFPEDIQRKLKDVPCLAKKLPTKEKVYILNPDFLIGWKSSFNAMNLGPIEELNDAGIQTFYFNSSKENGSLELFYNDLRKLSKILDIEKEVEIRIENIKKDLNSIPKEPKNETILFISQVGKTPSAIGGKGLLQSIMNKTGYKNVFENVNKNYFNTSWEKIIDTPIDNLVIIGLSHEDFIKKYKRLMATGYFDNKNAVKNKNIFYINYVDTAPNLNLGKLALNLYNKKLLRYDEILKK